jgi:uncharacterized protein with GYD domain
MSKYIVLINYTEQGIRDIRQDPERRRAVRERLRAMGATREFYLTMGPYDAVAVADSPSDEAMAGNLLALGGQGAIRTITMRAFTEEETDRIIRGLPPA